MNALVVCAVVQPGLTELTGLMAAGADLRVGVDGGARTLMDAGIVPDLVVGDADSLCAEDLDSLRQRGVELQLHPRHKDATDLDLAVSAVRRRGIDRIVVLGATGGRLDQTLATIGTLSGALDLHPEIADPGLRGWFLSREFRPDLAFETVGMRVSVQALSPHARVKSHNLRWSLDDLDLALLGSRGVSNVVEATPATLVVVDGVVLVTACEYDSATHTCA